MGVLYVILAILVVGLLIGALARLIVPGTRRVSLTATILLGVAGAAVGSLVYWLFGGTDTDGIDWKRLLFQVVAAIVFVAIYVPIARRKRRRDR
jgi:uncharacterized membrane protein YeaQ/YmgE (transglycosylase-associated protein family)